MSTNFDERGNPKPLRNNETLREIRGTHILCKNNME